MTTYCKLICTLLCLNVCVPVRLLWAQTVVSRMMTEDLRAAVEALGSGIRFSATPSEECQIYYLAGQLTHRFHQALAAERLTQPPRDNALYFWGQFPDTISWQQRQKTALATALSCALTERVAEQKPKVLFVREGAAGDGSSWEQAYGDLQQALAAARPGHEIWVARGVYFPTRAADRQVSFVIPDSVALYGGFAGGEKDRSERNWQKNLTILSGEIGREETSDNSYTVVYTEQVSEQTIVDGFVITGGYADGVQELGDPRRCGGGWYNDGAGGISRPVVANCLFVHNYARDGGAFYNHGRAGAADPGFIHCQFVSNRADLDGGGLFADGREGASSIRIEHCLFAGNRANFGAAISNRSEAGRSILDIEQSAFESNVAYVRKVIHNGNEGLEANFILSIRATRFADNISVVGEDENTTQAEADDRKLKRGEIYYFDF